MSASRHLSIPALVIVDVLAGGEMAGVAGMFLSVPVIAAVRIVSRRLQAPENAPADGEEREGSVGDAEDVRDPAVDPRRRPRSNRQAGMTSTRPPPPKGPQQRSFPILLPPARRGGRPKEGSGAAWRLRAVPPAGRPGGRPAFPNGPRPRGLGGARPPGGRGPAPLKGGPLPPLPGPLVYHIYFDRSGLPDLEPFIRFELSTIGHVYDAQGTVLVELAREYRRVVSYDEVPLILRQAILAAEDKNFFSHSGVDYRALPRVVQKTAVRSLAAWWKGGVDFRLRFPQGGSTLTQQLVRGYFLQDRASRENGAALFRDGVTPRLLSAALGASRPRTSSSGSWRRCA